MSIQTYPQFFKKYQLIFDTYLMALLRLPYEYIQLNTLKSKKILKENTLRKYVFLKRNEKKMDKKV